MPPSGTARTRWTASGRWARLAGCGVSPQNARLENFGECPGDVEVSNKTRVPNLDELARQLAQAVPQGLKAVGDDLENNFKSLLQAGIERLDLVSRDEFDVQVAVLARTRAKLEALEARLAEFETATTQADSP